MSLIHDFLHRVRTSLVWIGAQFVCMLLLVLCAIGWTRIPDSHGWQVLFTVLIPLLLLGAFLVLQAGTMRRMVGAADRRVGFAGAVISLLVWVSVAALAWWFLDWCSDQTIEWATYLNSKAPAGLRASIMTYDHLQHWITGLIWIVRWIVLPAKVIPHAMAAAAWGWRAPWLRVWRMLLNWRWWVVAIIAALVAVDLPAHFYMALPRGTVSHQVWSIALKLAANYLLAIAVWSLSLAWCAALLMRTLYGNTVPAEESGTSVEAD